MGLAQLQATVEQGMFSDNMVFVLLGMMLIFFMQAGFMLVEVGFTRAKHAAHVAMTNTVIFVIGTIVFWIVGFALMFGGVGGLPTLGGGDALNSLAGLGSGFGLVGLKGFLLGTFADGTYGMSIFAFFLLQLMFMDTAATIVTGAMAERWKFSAFLVFGVFMAGFAYPLYGNWIWGGGWLSQLGATAGLGNGAVDFAGSSAVHMIGGFAALAGAKVLGARIGKFRSDGTPVAIPGHNIPLAIAGTIILVFGWMAFNGMSTLSSSDPRMAIIIVNTLLGGSAGCLVAMGIVWKLWGKPDPSMTANGLLAGLVAVTAGCAFIAPWAAIVIGSIAGGLVVASVMFVERKMKIDDPVGAVSVHGVNGAWGMIALGLFADGTYGSGFGGIDHAVTGLFYGGGFGQLGAQLTAVLVAGTWAYVTHYVFFRVQDRVMGIRSSAEDEIAGLDPTEMGVLAYPDFSVTGLNDTNAAQVMNSDAITARPPMLTDSELLAMEGR